MHIKATARYHLPPVRVLSSINQQTANVREDVEKKKPHALLVRIQIDAATVQSSVEFPKNIKNGTAL